MEMVRSVSKRAFVKSLQQLIPEITEDDLVAGRIRSAGAGVDVRWEIGGRFSDSERKKFHSRLQRALAGRNGLT